MRIAVGMSGGVDSSLSTALLLEQGHEVIGVTMRLGIAELHGRSCCGEEDALLARRVCASLGIPHVVLDVAEAFADSVVEPFAAAYAAGLTPNPCVICNERVKFRLLDAHARTLGCDALATGHYARVVRDADGRARLARGVDAAKDQSYFLYRLSPGLLERVCFPLGDLTKRQVRDMAAERHLVSAKRAESQEVCFTDDHVALVGRSHPEALVPGAIVTEDGTVVGTHQGIARYTVGQRKGLGIGGSAGPLHVVALDAARNEVVVSRTPAMHVDRITLGEPVWCGPSEQTDVSAQLRYRAPAIAARALRTRDHLEVTLNAPVAATAPGQSVVLYDGDLVIGGGVLLPS